MCKTSPRILQIPCALCVQTFATTTTKAKKVISIAHFSRPPLWMQQPIYFDHCGWCTAVGCNSKKKIFFQDAYQEASNVWYEKMKKKTSCILSFSPTQCRHKMFFNFKNQWSRKDLVLNISPLALVYLYGMTYHFFRITRYILGVRAEQKFLFGQEGKQTQ